MQALKLVTKITSVAAVAAALAASSAHAAGLLIPAGGGPPLAIEEQDVRVHVTDGIAVTEVRQVFRNDGPTPLEAVYSFPLPQGASLAGFSMTIGGREMEGEVLEREKARRFYEEIVHPEIESQDDAAWKERNRQLSAPVKDPGLVEEVSYREFRMTIFPVVANGTQAVKLTYYQQLPVEGELVTYTYPLETRAPESSGGGRFVMDVTVHSSVPVEGFAFPSQRGEKPVVDVAEAHRLHARLERADGDLDRDFVMTWRIAPKEPDLQVLTYRKAGEDGYFLLLATAPADVAAADVPTDYTFVVDVSGSMRKERRLDLAAESIARFMDSCGDEDRFDVVAFNVVPQALSAKMLPNDQSSRQALRQFLRRFPGVGGTDLYPALEMAYGQGDDARPHVIVVVSDGGVSDLDEDHARFLELARQHEARIFGLSVGNDSNWPLLEALATETGGFTAQVSSEDDVDRRGAMLRSRMRQEPYRDLELEVSGARVLLVAPARIPDLYPGAQLPIFGRFSGEGKATFALSGTRGGKRALLSTSVELPEQASLHPEIRRAWAERRTRDLLQDVRAGRLSPAAKAEVVRLGEEHCIVTRLTSFLVLENDEMYSDRGIARRNHALLEEEAAAREERARQAEAAARIAPERPRPREIEWSVPSGGGGGAVDPLFLAALALLALSPVLRKLVRR